MPLVYRHNVPWGARRHAGRPSFAEQLLTAARRAPTSPSEAPFFEKFSKDCTRGQIRSRNQTHLPDDG